MNKYCFIVPRFFYSCLREIISANLLASRLTLLYGASGVGKSSVLRAGVIHNLRQRARQNLAARGTPEFGVAFSAWRDYPLAALAERINEQLAPLKVNDEDVAQLDPTTQFAEFLAAWAVGSCARPLHEGGSAGGGRRAAQIRARRIRDHAG